MSKTSTKDIKRYSLIKEMSRLYTKDAGRFYDETISTAAKSQRKTRLSISFTKWVKEILSIVEENKHEKLFVSFIDPYEENGKMIVPPLGVNPTISYNTPHGVYCYPLNNKNVYRLLVSGSPTDANFAVDRDYMHILKVSSENLITINRDFSTNYIDKKINRDIRTITTTFINFVTRYFDVNSDSYLELTHDTVKRIYDEYVVKGNSVKSIIDRLERQVIQDSLSDTNAYFDRLEHSRFYQLYYVAWYYSTLVNHLDCPLSSGGLFTLLLSSVGVKGIDDSVGSSLLHSAEPSQAFIADTTQSSGNNYGYTLIGTYLSPKAWFNKRADRTTYVEAIDKIISKAIDEGIIDPDVVFPRDFEEPATLMQNVENTTVELSYLLFKEVNSFFDDLKESNFVNVKKSITSNDFLGAIDIIKNLIVDIEAKRKELMSKYIDNVTEEWGMDKSKFIHKSEYDKFTDRQNYHNRLWWALSAELFPSEDYGPIDEYKINAIKQFVKTKENKLVYRKFAYQTLNLVNSNNIMPTYMSESFKKRLDKIFDDDYFSEIISESSKIKNIVLLKSYIRNLLLY